MGGGLLAIAGTVITILSYFSAVNANVQASNALAAAPKTSNAEEQDLNCRLAAATQDIAALRAQLAALA